MYKSIPHSDGLLTVHDALTIHSDYNTTEIQIILDLIRLILENNCFSFNSYFFRQIRGTAMGCPFAPAYANIFMAYLWKSSICRSINLQPTWMKRYIDDFIAIFPIDSPSLNTLNSSLNSCHHSVKFTTSPPSASVAFLDTLITLTDSGLTSDLYSKPTDSHHYLSPSSNHPKHIFYSIVYSGALRLRRICSSDELFQTRLKEFLSYLLSSGYSSSFIKPIFQKVASFDRLSLLNPSRHQTQSHRTTFVSTFHPRMPNIQQLHNKHKHILQSSDLMSSVLPSQPLVSHKRTATIGNLCISTKSPSPTVPSTRPFGTHPCNSKRCLLNLHLITSSSITSSSTNSSFPILHHISCNTTNIIYVITCKHCRIQYTGQTCNSLRTRFNNHKSTVRKPDLSSPVGRHFNLPDHNGVSDILIQGVEVVANRNLLNERESCWMWKLKTHHSVGGLNLDEPHLHQLTISN